MRSSSKFISYSFAKQVVRTTKSIEFNIGTYHDLYIYYPVPHKKWLWMCFNLIE